MLWAPSTQELDSASFERRNLLIPILLHDGPANIKKASAPRKDVKAASTRHGRYDCDLPINNRTDTFVSQDYCPGQLGFWYFVRFGPN